MSVSLEMIISTNGSIGEEIGGHWESYGGRNKKKRCMTEMKDIVVYD